MFGKCELGKLIQGGNPMQPKVLYFSRCPHCGTRVGCGFYFEWEVCQGEYVAYYRCVLCGERPQDHIPDRTPDTPMLRHRMPDSNLVGG
jgi:DNA-directed RNA polymerase subunit RPC12/RpoP